MANKKVGNLKQWFYELFNSKWEVHAFAWGYLGWLLANYSTIPVLKTALIGVAFILYGFKGIQEVLKFKIKEMRLPISVRKEPLRYLLGLALAMLTIEVYKIAVSGLL